MCDVDLMLMKWSNALLTYYYIIVIIIVFGIMEKNSEKKKRNVSLNVVQIDTRDVVFL